MNVQLEEWRGLFEGYRIGEPDLLLTAVLADQHQERGGSRPFCGLGHDGHVYWIKMVQNKQSPRVPATELIVSACGKLIGAPVCETRRIYISEDFNNDILENGTVLHRGTAHASREVPNAIFDKTCLNDYRRRDDNRRRHAQYFALYDWCWGDDMQWLYDAGNDMTTYSHDHGLFLPGGPNWTADTLLSNIDSVRELPREPVDLDVHALEETAATLDHIGRYQLRNALSDVPTEWPVSDSELEVLGYFLEYRKTATAARLRQLAATLAG